MQEYLSMHKINKIYIISLGMLTILLIQGWKFYNIHFSDLHVFRHAIYTNDFLLFVICIFIASLDIIINIITKQSNLTLKCIRIIGLIGLSVLYFLNYTVESKITANTVAQFTWQFYTFGVILVSSVITGLLGVMVKSKINSRSINQAFG